MLAERQRMLHSRYLHFHMLDGLTFTGEVNTSILQQALNDVVARHTALRTGFSPMGDLTPAERLARLTTGGWLTYAQWILPSYISIPLKVEPILGSPSEEARVTEQLLRREYECPFTLDDPPLMRAVLIRFGRHRSTLVLVVH